VPRTQYTKPPGPFWRPDQIPRVHFRFTEQQQRALGDLLPARLHSLSVPDEYKDKATNAHHQPGLQTLADLLVSATESEITSYLTSTPFISSKGAQPSNPANVRAAIRRLREHLKPFVHGWVDDKTADLIPDGLDDALAAREQELKSVKVTTSAGHRNLGVLCASIGVWIRNIADANDSKMRKRDVRKFVTTALDCAGINYPDPDSHPARLDKLIFP